MNRKIIILACSALSLIACKDVRKEYYDNGFVKLEAEYEENKPDGVTKMYDPEGNILLKANYSKGFLNGKRIVYFPTGEVDSMETYKKGMLDGPFEYYVKAQIYDLEKKDSTEKIILSRKGAYANPRVLTSDDIEKMNSEERSKLESELESERKLIPFCYKKKLPNGLLTSTCQGTVKVYYVKGPAAGKLAGELSYDKKGRLKKEVRYFGNGKKSEEFSLEYQNDAVTSTNATHYAPNGDKIFKRNCVNNNEEDKWGYDEAKTYGSYAKSSNSDYDFCKQENFIYQKNKKVVSSFDNGRELFQIGDQVWLSGIPESEINWNKAVSYCPNGTRLPTKREYRILWNYIKKNSEFDKFTNGKNVRADKYPNISSIRIGESHSADSRLDPETFYKANLVLPTYTDLEKRAYMEYQNSSFGSHTQGCNERRSQHECDFYIEDDSDYMNYSVFDEFGFFSAFSEADIDIWTYEGSTINKDNELLPYAKESFSWPNSWSNKGEMVYFGDYSFRCVDRNCLSLESFPEGFTQWKNQKKRNAPIDSRIASAGCIQAPGHTPSAKISWKHPNDCSDFISISLFLKDSSVNLYPDLSSNDYPEPYTQKATPQKINISEIIQQLENITNSNLNSPSADIVNLYVETRDPAFKDLIDSIYAHGYLIELHTKYSNSDKEAQEELDYYNSLGISATLHMEAAYTNKFCSHVLYGYSEGAFGPDENKKIRRLTDDEFPRKNASAERGVLKLLSAGEYDLMKNQKFSKDIDRVLKDVAGLQTTGKTQLGGRRGGADGGFNEGYAEGGSGGIGDGLAGLLGGGGGGIATKAKGSIKTPTERDINMSAGSPRSVAEIQKVVKQRTPGLRHTYNKFLKKKPGFAGKVTLKFTIAPGGEIISISIASSTTGFSEFDNEIKNAVKRWPFGVIKSGNTTVTIPFTFSE